MPRGTIVLLTRWPVPGQTKSRLAATLGAEVAAHLARAFLLDVLAMIHRVPDVARVMAVTGATSPPTDALDFAWPTDLRLLAQQGADLGERMIQVFREVGAPVVFVGSDAPTLPSRFLDEAFDLLERGADVVFQPALDGGYTLAGFRRDPTPLLRCVPWGTSEVLDRSLALADEARLSVELLDPWYDIDEPRDLIRLRAHLASASRDVLAAETARVLHERDLAL